MVMSALPPKADMCGATRDVCFGPKADKKPTFAMLAMPPTMDCQIECLAGRTDGFIQAKRPSVPIADRAKLFPIAGDENPRCRNCKSAARAHEFGDGRQQVDGENEQVNHRYGR